MKSIVLFSDGTGNSAGSPHKTNVWRLYKALKVNPGANQIAYYDDGVGTSSNRLLRVLGLVFGLGLASNVRSIYGFACRAYQQGDTLHGFGFSRGAFTMRVVMALITSEGLIDPSGLKDNEFEAEVEKAYRRFRTKSFSKALFSFIPYFWSFISRIEKGNSVKVFWPDITMLGVWDTVDAYGMPIDEMRSAWDHLIFPLAAQDRNCPVKVKHAYHALAMDEQRLSFAPILWNEKKTTSNSENDQHVCQVWFPGVHADIGGGYPDPSLSLVSLSWMMQQAEQHGLQFKKELKADYLSSADISGPMHDSRSGSGFLYRFEPRNVESLSRDHVKGKILTFLEKFTGQFSGDPTVHIETPLIHQSVFQRIDDRSTNYAPINIPEHFNVVDDTNQVIRQGAAPEESARRKAQGDVWNLSAMRKLIYVANTGLVFLLAYYMFKQNHPELPLESGIFAKSFTWISTFIVQPTNVAFILGTIGSLLFLGGVFKKLTHVRMKDIWNNRSNEKYLRALKTSFFPWTIYDDKIVNGKIKQSFVSGLKSKFGLLLELASMVFYVTLICYPVWLLWKRYGSAQPNTTVLPDEVKAIFMNGFALVLPFLIVFGITRFVLSQRDKA